MKGPSSHAGAVKIRVVKINLSRMALGCGFTARAGETSRLTRSIPKRYMKIQPFEMGNIQSLMATMVLISVTSSRIRGAAVGRRRRQWKLCSAD